MTREELINQRATTCRHDGHCEWVACDKCNHYEPDVLNQQPCEDCISRETVKQLYYKDGYIAFRKICNLPSVTPKEKTGHWMLQPSNKEQGERDFIWWKCSECGQVIFSETKKDRREYHAYCGRCGAKMIEPQENDG